MITKTPKYETNEKLYIFLLQIQVDYIGKIIKYKQYTDPSVKKRKEAVLKEKKQDNDAVTFHNHSH